MLNIKSTESFKQANKKTNAVAFGNGKQYSRFTSPNYNSSEEIKKVLYGDIPSKYIYKQTKNDGIELQSLMLLNQCGFCFSYLIQVILLNYQWL